MVNNVRVKDILMGRLPHGGDMLKELTQLCRRHGVTLGKVTALGAVQVARIQYYNQSAKEYEESLIEEPMELTSLVGNISERDGEPFVHAHVTLSARDGKVTGGHLGEGTVVFAAEYVIERYEGAALRRQFDGVTGLFLWR